jgi:hypothetical protein
LLRWTTFTPDGRRLVVNRHPGGWTVVCGDREEVQHELLDIALIEALRQEIDFDRSRRIDYAEWTRALADRIQREAESDKAILPQKGDRIELVNGPFGVSARGTVEYVDQLQILVKWDDGRSSSLRVGTDRFRILP